MSTPSGTVTTARQATPALLRPHAERLVAAGGPRVVVVRARPAWTAGDLTVQGRPVRVRPAVSQLAALEALADLAPEDYLILLSDQTDTELGDVVLAATGGRGAEALDEWAAVPPMFGATTVDPALRRLSWAPLALLEHQPPGGWPRVATGVVTADHAIGCLLAAVLGLPLPVELDPILLMSALDDLDGRERWLATDDDLRRHLADWATGRYGTPAGTMLRAAGRSRVSVTALGLALDVLFHPGDGSIGADQVAAQARIEAHLDGRKVSPADVAAVAGLARTLALRLDAEGSTTLPVIFQQAEALLDDVGWPQGAERSVLLPAGLTARLRHLAGLLTPVAGLAERLLRIEGALGDVVEHLLARTGDLTVEAARAAVRLARWLASDVSQPGDLGAALNAYVADGAWVDRALAAVWDGSADPVVAAAYADLAAHVRARRAAQDRDAATALAAATERGETPPGAAPIERVLDDVVAPIAQKTPVLVVLLDGMSVPVATQIVDEAAALGWIEHVPADTRRRLPVLAALPTLTEVSRTAFFTGTVQRGGAGLEASALRARLGAPLFHKDDLRSPAGQSLSDEVRAAIDDPDQRVVAVVLNTIDDTLHKVEGGALRWRIDDVTHLRALLNAAGLAGRAVVLTSDHGHVVERGSEARPAPGAAPRARAVESGPAGEGEVLVRGTRVADGAAILPWREDLRYANRAAGYHGGASLAEITVPLVVLAHGVEPRGWVPATPQAPAWWNEARRPAEVARPAPGGRRGRRGAGHVQPSPVEDELARTVPTPAEDEQGLLPIDLPATRPARAPLTDDALADALVASEVFAVQHRRAGRGALSPERVRAVVAALLANGGRAHRDTVASLLGVPASSFLPTFRALSRLLNVEGYPTVVLDPDGVTVQLDRDLLVEQFDLGGRRG